MYDVIVVGGGMAGLTSALYILRSGKSVLVLESENFGGQITFAPRVENYPGILNISGNKLAESLVEQTLALGAEVELDTVCRIENFGVLKRVITNRKQYECKSVIIATGVRHRKLGIEREEGLSGKGISYCAICDGAFFKGKDVAVVGGGSSALQSALYLASHCKNVYLIHRRNKFRGEESLVRRVELKENIKCFLNMTVCELCGKDSLESIMLIETDSGAKLRLEAEGLFVTVGQVPFNDAFSDLVKIDENGYIVADEDCKTSCDGVFVAGDCRAKSIRQLTTAAADGAVAALAACDYADSIS